jgi:GTP cyclohydrolase I
VQRDGDSHVPASEGGNGETELQAAERRIRDLPRCGAARVATLEKSFHEILEAVGEDPQREGLLKTPAERRARSSS